MYRVSDATEPIFVRGGDSAGEPRDRPVGARDTVAALKTYRYLRLGMLVVVASLAAGIVLNVVASGQLRTSISAYYYSPVGAIFVGGLLAIGVSMIVIKGRNAAEDFLLNMAGMLALVVAVVPTTDRGDNESTLLPEVADAAMQSFGAVLIGGFVAFAIGTVVLSLDQRSTALATRRSDLIARLLLLVTTFVILLGCVTATIWGRDLVLASHGVAAPLMFVCLAAASLINGVLGLRQGRASWARWYLAVALGMAAAAPLMLINTETWAHRTLWVELIEIGFFALLWAVQTVEHWGKVVSDDLAMES